ncbi:MAG: hypothetical protein RR386_05855 [Bacteroidaceae bacterium]
MKAVYQISELPVNGVLVKEEGTLLRVWFDFESLPIDNKNKDALKDLYSCEIIDVENSRRYGNIVSGIVTSRYSVDDVQALMANYTESMDTSSTLLAEKRSEYIAEYVCFQNWRKHSKEIACKVLDELK